MVIAQEFSTYVLFCQYRRGRNERLFGFWEVVG